MTPIEEKELMILFKSGDRVSFKIIFDAYNKRFFAYAYKFIRHIQESEDIVADTWVKVFHKKESFASFSHIRTFSFFVIKNAGIDLYRKKNKVNIVLKEDLYYLTNEKEDDPEEVKKKENLILELISKIESLPNQRKSIVKSVFLFKMSTKEVADNIGIQNQTVLNHKAKAIKDLREKLIPYLSLING